jgi:hypothetical protein
MVGQMPTTSGFIWGRGGRRRSLEDISLERRLAQQQMLAGSDFSPVQHWTQGLARVANGLAGGFRMQQADNQAEEARTAQQGVIEALLAGQAAEGGPDPVAAALADPELRQLGMTVLASRTPKPVEPSIQRRNDGSIIGINPMTGEIMFEQADPNPKPVIDWQMVTDPVTRAVTYVPFGPNGPIAGGGPPNVIGSELPEGWSVDEGGPGGSPSGAGFRP